MEEHLVICIARQFGSGGREAGRLLAQEMQLTFYDKELLREAAKKSGIVEELFERADEKPSSSLLYSLSALGTSGNKAPSFSDYTSYMPDDRLQNIVGDVIRETAEKGSCVIIGRCADYILRGRKKTLSVFFHASLDKRIQRIQRMHNLDEDAARSLIRKTDRSRANYYNFYTDRDWGSADNYDLVVDIGRLGPQKSATLVKEATELFCQ